MTENSGGTNYNKWNKLTKDLLEEVEKEEEEEKQTAAESLGHTRIPYSEAEAKERAKAEIARKTKAGRYRYICRSLNSISTLTINISYLLLIEFVKTINFKSYSIG